MNRRNFIKTIASAIVLSPLKPLFDLIPKTVAWQHFALTWSKSADCLTAYDGSFSEKFREVTGDKLIAYWTLSEFPKSVWTGDRALTPHEITYEFFKQDNL